MYFLRYCYVPAAALAMVALAFFTATKWRKNTPRKAMLFWAGLALSIIIALINVRFLK
jgi:uncharacterized membrane protein YvbJ